MCAESSAALSGHRFSLPRPTLSGWVTRVRVDGWSDQSARKSGDEANSFLISQADGGKKEPKNHHEP